MYATLLIAHWIRGNAATHDTRKDHKAKQWPLLKTRREKETVPLYTLNHEKST